VFKGGVAKQIIPGEAQMHIDLRARTDADAKSLSDEIRRIANDAKDTRVSVELSGRLTRPAFTTERNRELCTLAKSVAAELGIIIFEVDPTGGGSDGNFSAALGVPTLDGLGPVTDDVCTPTETIDIASLADRGALFCGIIQRIAATRGN
jgi:glutamate carboxypeptidase